MPQASSSCPARSSASREASFGRCRRSSRAFATITTLFALGLIAQAIFIGSTISGNFGERYLFFFIPLLPLAFVLYARRGGAKGPVLAIAGVLAVLAMRFPLSHYAGRSSDSPTLWGVLGFETWFGVATARC